MGGRVIQGFFLGGAIRPQPAPPAAAQAGPRRSTAVPPPANAGRAAPLQPRTAPGRPPLAHPGAGHVAQPHGGDGSFEIDPARIGLARGGGRPLPQALLAKMEAAFGADFSGVRVHIGPQAPRIGAIAFTAGNDLYFAPGQYQPESIKGQQLIGHELAHVIQQRQGRVRAPGSGMAVVQDRMLEAEADRLGMRAAAHRPALQAKMAGRQPGPAAPRSPSRAVQRYAVLGRDKIYGSEPASRPWSGYPYAVIPPGTHFSAQQRAGGGGGVNEFLLPGHSYRAANTAHVVDRKTHAVTLRVSSDGRMAIEDSNLTGRQPKVFFATAAVIAAANTARNPGSIATLHQGGETIKILTGWYSQETLYRVKPVFTAQPSQNCDELAGQITAVGGGLNMQSGVALNDTIADLLDHARSTFDMNNAANVATYVNTRGTGRARERTLGLNAGARPEVGGAFVIGTTGYPIAWAGAQAQVLDIASNQVRTLGWAFHYGAVVARSGADRVTLENYARGDNRRAGFDPRWYFQMYGEAAGQSFHEFHEARREYANPATVTTGGPNVPLPWRWNPFG